MRPSARQRARHFLRDNAEKCPPEAQQLIHDLLYELCCQHTLEGMERLHMAVSAANLGVWDQDFVTGTTVWNDHLYNLLALPRQTPVNSDTLYAHVHPDDRSWIRRQVKETLEEGTELLTEFRIVRQDGAVRWVLNRGKVYRSRQGRPVRFCGITQDITQKKENETTLRHLNETLEDLFTIRSEELHRSEELYRTLVESANSIILRWKLDGRITFINRFGLNFFGYQEEELVGRSIIGTLLRAVDRNGRDMRGLLQDIGERPYMYVDSENENMRRNGERVWIYWTNRAIRDETGHVIEVLSIGNDRTLQHQAEAALRESEHRFRMIFHNAADGIILADADSRRFVDANPAACKMFGYGQEEMKSLTVSDIHPEDQIDDLIPRFDARVRGEKRTLPNTAIKRKDGGLRYVDINAFPLSLGGRLCLAGIFRDVTERRRAERQRIQHKERLRHLASSLAAAQDEEQQRIATGLHDNVAQWLVAADLKLALLHNQPDSSRRATILDDLGSLISKATESVRSLSFELGSSTLHRLGLAAGIRELCSALGARHGLQIDLVDDEQPKGLPISVSTVLFKCTRELLFNVVKHAGVEQATVYLCRKGSDVTVTVEDLGQGLAETDSASEPAIGNGLGLFAINERMRDIGGSLEADSKPAQHTRMTLRVPVGDEDCPSLPDAQPPA